MIDPRGDPLWKKAILAHGVDGGWAMWYGGLTPSINVLLVSSLSKILYAIITLEIFLAQPPEQEAAYIVTYNEFPDSYVQMNSPQKIMDEAQYMELTTTKSRLLNQRNIRSSNFQPGKEIEYVNAIGKVTKTRMFVAHGRLYKVMAIVSKKQHDSLNKTITGYLNSFQLVVKP